MSQSMSDRNLLFGILAVQMDFIDRDSLISAMHAWVLEKSKPLGRILLEQQKLDAATSALLDALVEKHLELHGNDAQRSLAAVGVADRLGADLRQVGDAEVHASIVRCARSADPIDPYATGPVDPPGPSGPRFHVLRAHARGALGEVLVAHDTELDREVALKWIQEHSADDPESRTRFVLEAAITGGLEHPGIVPVYSLGKYPNGRPYYAMRFVRGESLAKAIDRYHSGSGDQAFALRQLLSRFVAVCQAMQYAHDRGVLHRDLKPDNIMLGKYGETLVVDWGLAKVRDAKEAQPAAADERPLRVPSVSGSHATLDGTIVGTPAFMSPEQATGRLDLLTPSSDVYSLGATLYALLTGKVPCDDPVQPPRRPNVVKILEKIRLGDYPKPRQVKANIAPALEAICLKAMALEPASRYPSARALAHDIERWLADEPVSACVEPWSIRAGRWARKHKPLLSGCGVGLVVALIALTFALRRESNARGIIDQALEQTRVTRQALHARLKQPNGVQELLNQPARWEAQLESARTDWRRAKERESEVLGSFWSSQIVLLENDLTRDEADYELAARLEKIRLDMAMQTQGRTDLARTERDYAAAFKDAGLQLAPGKIDADATWIEASPIKTQLVAALDDWAYVAQRRQNGAVARRLLEVSRRADPEPWRDKVRDVVVWDDDQSLLALADKVRADRAFLSQLSPQLLALVGHLLSAGKVQEDWLRQAQALHPADFWINFQLGMALFQKRDLLEAAGFFRVALAVRPQMPWVWSCLAHCLYAHDDLPATIEACRKSIAFGGDDKPHFVMGFAARDNGDFAAAAKAFRAGAEVNRKNKGWQMPSEPWINQCDRLLALDQRLAETLAGKAASVEDLRAMADLCQRYKRRYQDAFTLYARAFAAEPQRLAEHHAYHAAGAAAHTVDKLDAKEAPLRRAQALQWLQADLAARAKLHESDPVAVYLNLPDWRHDAALAVLRDVKYLGDYSADERLVLTKFWTEVDRFTAQVRASYVQTDHFGQLHAKEPRQSYSLKMTAGATYIIDMVSPHFDTFVRLTDAEGKVLAEDDDIDYPKNLNSRIKFKATQSMAGKIVAMSFQYAETPQQRATNRGAGTFSVTIRAFAK